MAKSKPKIFISHSTSKLPDNDRTIQIRDFIFDILSAKGWDVFLDKEEIKPGDKWRTKILQNLEQSQAGIILFNKKATSESYWVPAEALILCYRKSIYPEFKLIAILLDKKDIKDKCFKIYEPFQLNETQFVEDDPSLEPRKFVMEKIAANLDPEIAGLPPDNPWVANIIPLLKTVGKKDPNILVQVAEKLELTLDNGCSVLDEIKYQDVIIRPIAELMHHNLYKKSFDVYGKLIFHMDIPDANRLGSILKTKWVENLAAEILLCGSRNPEKFGFFTLNWIGQEIEVYLSRIHIEIKDEIHYFVSVNSREGGDNDDAKLDAIEKAIIECIFPYGLPLGKDDKEQSLQKALKDLKEPAIFPLPLAYATKGVIEKLNQDFPGITFIVQAGSEAEKLMMLNSLGGKPLIPLLDITKHNEFRKMGSDMDSAMKNKKKFDGLERFLID